ncbi:MAG: branched-chain amino acid ABC transporter permease [Acidimicrobiales bacterium]
MTGYVLSVLTSVVVYMIAGLGLNVEYGWGGLLNITYITFVAIGAYVSATLTLGPASALPAGSQVQYILGFHLPWILGVIGGMVAAGLLGLVVGVITLRKLRADYFAIGTLAVGLILYTIIGQDRTIFNAQEGLYNVPRPLSSALNWGLNGYDIMLFALCVAFLIGVYILCELLYRSPFGRAARSTRQDEIASAAFGKNAFTLQLKLFVVGSALGGLAGALLVTYAQAYNPAAWQATETFFIFVAIFIGGTSNNRGVLVGIFVVEGLITEATRYLPQIPNHPDAIPSGRQILIGVLIVVILRFRPQGVFPEPTDRDELVERRTAGLARRGAATTGLRPGARPPVSLAAEKAAASRDGGGA